MTRIRRRRAQSVTHLSLGRAVQQLRNRQRLSRRTLAHRAAMKPRALARLEQGRHDPTAELLVRLCEGLGVPGIVLGLQIENELYLTEIGGPRKLRLPSRERSRFARK